jgi:hypothetical protein
VIRRWWAPLRDPGVRAAAALALVAGSGFVVVALAWRGAAAQRYVSQQLPFVVSGAAGGLALSGAALAFLIIHLDRRAAAERRAAMDDVVRDVTAIAEAIRARRAR